MTQKCIRDCSLVLKKHSFQETRWVDYSSYIPLLIWQKFFFPIADFYLCVCPVATSCNHTNLHLYTLKCPANWAGFKIRFVCSQNVWLGYIPIKVPLTHFLFGNFFTPSLHLFNHTRRNTSTFQFVWSSRNPTAVLIWVQCHSAYEYKLKAWNVTVLYSPFHWLVKGKAVLCANPLQFTNATHSSCRKNVDHYYTCDVALYIKYSGLVQHKITSLIS